MFLRKNTQNLLNIFSWQLNDKSLNPFGFDLKSGTNNFLVFVLELVPTQIFFGACFKYQIISHNVIFGTNFLPLDL